MINFIKAQENIIKEICNEDVNYKASSLSFIEKTLKVVTNETDKTAFDLIDEYIIDLSLLNKIHNIRKKGNVNKHGIIENDNVINNRQDEFFSLADAMNCLKILNEYLSFIQDNYKNTIETEDFIKLYDEIKKELEKKQIVEKKVAVVKKEIVTVEKPVYKKITSKESKVKINDDYTEVQLLNESNGKGLFINALNIRAYEYAINDILLKKIKNNLALKNEENEVLRSKIKNVYNILYHHLFEDKVFLYFDEEVLIDLIFYQKDIDLIYKYLSLKDEYNLQNRKLFELLCEYIKSNKDDSLKIIINYKKKIKPIYRLWEALSNCLSSNELIEFINDYEDDSEKERLSLKEIEKKYYVKLDNDSLKALKKYPWGLDCICREYINGNEQISYELFLESYINKKTSRDRINKYILYSDKENILEIVKKLEKENISLVSNIYGVGYHSVNKDILKYYIDCNYISNDKYLLDIFEKSLCELDADIIKSLINKIPKVDIDFEEYRISEVKKKNQIEVLGLVLDKFKTIPNNSLSQCFDVNFALSCQLFGDYLLDNLYLLNKYKTMYGRRGGLYFYDESVSKIFEFLIRKASSKRQLELLLFNVIKRRKIAYYDFDEKCINLIKQINKKDVYIKDIMNMLNNFEIQEIFEDNMSLLNNLDKEKNYKIFYADIIIDNYDKEYVDLLFQNRKCSDDEFVRSLLDDCKFEVIKKMYDLGLNFKIKINDSYGRNYGVYDSAWDYYLNQKYSDEIDNDIVAFLSYIKAEQYISKQEIIKNENYKNEDFLDLLLKNEKLYVKTLDYLKENYELKEIYSDLLNTKTNDINVLRKKLFIDELYLNNSKNYDELLSFNITDINKYNISSKHLIKMLNYYEEKNDDNKITKLLKIKNKEFQDYLSTNGFILTKTNNDISSINTKEKEDKYDKNSEISLETKKTEDGYDKNNEISFETKAKKKARVKKKKNIKKFVLETIGYIAMSFLILGMASYLTIGFFLFIFNIEPIGYGLNEFIFHVTASIIVIIMVSIICNKKNLDMIGDGIIIKAWIWLLIFIAISFFIVISFSLDNFYKDLQLFDVNTTDKCTIIELKNNGENSHSISFEDVHYGWYSLYPGSNKKVLLNSDYDGTRYSDNEYTRSRNIYEIKRECNINYELYNPIVYSAYYETAWCGTGDNKYNCSGYRIADSFNLKSGDIVTLVFETTNTNQDLKINSRVITKINN